MLSLQPNSVSLYPAGYFTRQIPVQMTVNYPGRLDRGVGRCRAQARRARPTPTRQTNYEMLVDSPILAGRYGKTLGADARASTSNVFADTPDELAATPEQIDAHKRLVDQAVEDCSARSITTTTNSCCRSPTSSAASGWSITAVPRTASTPAISPTGTNGRRRRNLLPHEFTHSWDGKFRRGADLWTPDFRTPMRNSLLWVYEGQTQFWGYVLQARSGLVSQAGHARRAMPASLGAATTPRRRGSGATWSTPPTIRSSRRAGPRAGPAGSAARIITTRG